MDVFLSLFRCHFRVWLRLGFLCFRFSTTQGCASQLHSIQHRNFGQQLISALEEGFVQTVQSVQSFTTNMDEDMAPAASGAPRRQCLLGTLPCLLGPPPCLLWPQPTPACRLGPQPTLAVSSRAPVSFECQRAFLQGAFGIHTETHVSVVRPGSSFASRSSTIPLSRGRRGKGILLRQ